MLGHTRQLAHPGQRWALARMSCLGLGAALLLWSLAPAVVERILTREAPRAQTLVLSSLTFLVGFAFLGLLRRLQVRKSISRRPWCLQGRSP